MPRHLPSGHEGRVEEYEDDEAADGEVAVGHGHEWSGGRNDEMRTSSSSMDGSKV